MAVILMQIVLFLFFVFGASSSMGYSCAALKTFSLNLFRAEEDESLAIKPPQQMARKDKSHHRKEEKRKDKRRHRSHSAEEGVVLLAKR